MEFLAKLSAGSLRILKTYPSIFLPTTLCQNLTIRNRAFLKDPSLDHWHSPYTSTVGGYIIIDKHGIGKMVYADNTQIYIVLDEDRALSVCRLEKCITDIKQWSAANDLKLNEDIR